MHARLIDRAVVPLDSRQTAEFAKRNDERIFLEGFAVPANKKIRAPDRQSAKVVFVSTQSRTEIRPDGNRSDPVETSATNRDSAPLHVHVLAQERQCLARPHSSRVKSQEEDAERSGVHPAFLQ